MDTDLFDQLAGVRFRFNARPSALPADLRPIWRVSVLLLVLNRCCRNGRASLQKLHVLNWAIRQSNARRALLDILDEQNQPDVAIVRYDPALNRALDLAKAERLIDPVGDARFQITAKGQSFVAEIVQDDSCMRDEKLFLTEVGSRLTETRISNLLNASLI